MLRCTSFSAFLFFRNSFRASALVINNDIKSEVEWIKVLDHLRNKRRIFLCEAKIVVVTLLQFSFRKECVLYCFDLAKLFFVKSFLCAKHFMLDTLDGFRD